MRYDEPRLVGSSTKLFAWGGGTCACATIDDEPRPVWTVCHHAHWCVFSSNKTVRVGYQ
jgi:hypothetical protein